MGNVYFCIMKSLQSVSQQIRIPFLVALMGTFFSGVVLDVTHNQNPLALVLGFIMIFLGYVFTRTAGPAVVFSQTFIFYATAFVVCGFLAFVIQGWELVYKFAAITILGILYNWKISPIKIRSIPFIKALYVGLVWALVISWMLPQTFLYRVFVLVFLLISALVLLSDIRDQNRDHVSTFANTLGIRNTQLLIYCFLAISLFHLFGDMKKEFHLSMGLTILLILFLTACSTWLHKHPAFTLALELSVGFPAFIYWIVP